MNETDPIDPLFQVHRLNAEGIEKAKLMAQLFSTLLRQLDAMTPPSSRDMAIVRTKLQEACFFAKRAMACLGENQE